MKYFSVTLAYVANVCRTLAAPPGPAHVNLHASALTSIKHETAWPYLAGPGAPEEPAKSAVPQLPPHRLF